MKIRTAMLAAALLIPLPVSAQEPAPTPTDPFVRQGGGRSPSAPFGGADTAADAPCNLSICVEAFSLDLAEAAKLHRGMTGDEELYRELVSRASKGGAVQEMFSVIRARSGEKVMLENISEQIYATDYYPLRYQAGGDPARTAPQPGKETSGKPQGPRPGTQEFAMEEKSSALPTSFETRNAGFSLEAEPTLSANREVVDLRISPDIVTPANRSKWGRENCEVEMPGFESQRLTLGMTVKPGVPALLGTPSRPPVSDIDPDSAKKVWFSFVTVSLIDL